MDEVKHRGKWNPEILLWVQENACISNKVICLGFEKAPDAKQAYYIFWELKKILKPSDPSPPSLDDDGDACIQPDNDNVKVVELIRKGYFFDLM